MDSSVGVALPANPLSSVGSRQHSPAVPGLQTALLASASPLTLCLPSGRANTARIFPARGLQCWRRPPRKALAFRRSTPTWPGFSRLAGSSVGVDILAKPLSSVRSRQHSPTFLGQRALVLASASPLSLCLPSGHANMVRIIAIGRLPRMKKSLLKA